MTETGHMVNNDGVRLVIPLGLLVKISSFLYFHIANCKVTTCKNKDYRPHGQDERMSIWQGMIFRMCRAQGF